MGKKLLMSRKEEVGLVYDTRSKYWVAPCLVCGEAGGIGDFRGAFCEDHYVELTPIVRAYYGPTE